MSKMCSYSAPRMCDDSYATILLIQLSEWIRGSRSEHVRKILQTVPNSSTYGVARENYDSRAGENLGKSTAMNIFTPSPHADAFLTEPKPVLLPKMKACSGNVLTTNLASSESAITTKKRNQALPIIRDLLSNPECWFEIKDSNDYIPVSW